MSTFKCKMCGGTLEIQSGSTVAECEYCGAKQTLPKLDDEKRANLYDRANHFRRSNEFDKATAIYEQILNEDGTDAEAYWSLVLCHYGIEYVEDPLSHRRVPTVHRAQFTSIFDDDNYKLALENADSYQRIIYEEEAKAINEIQKGILAISQKEEPFDVFICYKETDANGKRTHDSVLANDLYYQLKQEGFKVFFARITLEDKLGSAYEPYIFAALNSAKVMVVLGTKPEYFNAVWVRNEWSRFLSLIKRGEQKMLIPAYRDMDPYDLPKEFSHLQAQDMSKLGFMQDLIRGIKKILGKDRKQVETVTERVVVNNEGHDISPILRRTFLFLEDGEYDSADEYAEKVLDINPECAEAYVAKLLIELKLRKPADLASAKTPISDSPNYQKAIRFATPEYRETIEGYNNAIIKRIDTARKDEVYARGAELMKLHRYDEAVQYFGKITSYKDSAQKIEDCKKLKETERLDGIYSRAMQAMNAGHFDEAASLFTSISDYKDAGEKVKLCGEKKETARKDAIYSAAMQRVLPKDANDVTIKKSIEELHTISGYRDVDDQIRTLTVRLEKWYEDKKNAEEAARIKAEEERRTREREAELKRLKAEATKKKVKKVAKIGIPSVIALATLLVLLFTLVIPLIRYNTADKLFNEGKYDEAMKIYQDIGGFSESEQRIAVLNGIEKIDGTNFEDGIKEILAAGVPVKLTYGMGGGDFSGATYLSVPQNDANDGIMLLSASNTSDVMPLASTSDVPETTEFTYNSAADFAGIQTPGRNGYRFVKWELDAYNYQVEGTFEIKLNAVWSTKDYTVDYDLAQGTINGKNVVEYDPEDEAFTLINPTRTGYTFAGWIGTDLSEPQVNVTVPTGSYGDRTYTATWTANEYTVTYNAAGGTVSSETQTVTYDSNVEYLIPEWKGHAFAGWYEGNNKVTAGKWAIASDITLTAKWDIITYAISYTMNGGINATSNPTTYDVNSSITLAEPTKTGYTFKGWIGTDLAEPTKTVTIDDCTGNRSYTATWEVNTYTITLDADGGSVSPSSMTVTYDADFTLPTPTWSGHTFAGWYKGNNKVTAGKWAIASDITLTAKWDIVTYNISYIMNGGINATSNPKTYDVNSSITLAEPTKTGYTFKGWTGTDLAEPTKTVTIDDCTGNRSYTATWEVNTYTITLDADGGSVSHSSVTVDYDEKLTLPTPTKTGYTFAGWYNGNKRYSDGVWKGLSDITLTAKWTVNAYTVTYEDAAEIKENVKVTFNYNYTGSTPYTVTLSDGQNLTYPAVPTRSGYAFAGWYTNSSCTTAYNFSGTITSETTLYAKWVSMASSYSTREFVDIADYNSLNAKKTFSNITSYSSTSPHYYYFTCYTSGSYSITATNTTGSFYLMMYNVTQDKTVMNKINLSASRSSITTSFSANAGDVFYVSIYKYSNTSSTSSGTFYVANASYPTSTAKASSDTVKGYEYASGETLSISVEYGSSCLLPTLTRTGYTFNGWYNGNDKVESGVWNITSNVTLTAKWTENTYTVAFFSNGGTGSPASMIATYDADLTLPTPTRTGYTFAGWYNGSTKVTSGTWKIASNVMLMAHWNVVNYTVSYIMNGGTNNASNPSSYTVNDSFTLENPTRTGYTFLGWTCTGQTTPIKSVTISQGTVGNLSYTANWENNSYIVTFDPNGGSVTPTSKTATYDTACFLPKPTRTGYTFAGWYNGSTKYTNGTWKTASNITLTAKWTANTNVSYTVNHYLQNANDDGYTLESTQNLAGTADASVTPSVKSFTHFVSPKVQTVTIKPDGTLVVDYHYDRVTYDLTYVTNGGDTIEKQTYKYNQTLVISTPSRTGYTFGGWFTDKTLGTAYSATATLNEDTTIYAYWTEENKPTDFTYSGTSAITVSAYNGTSTTMWIPAYIGGVPVTTIPDSAFKNLSTLIKVVIPDTVTSIGNYILQGCTAIEEFTSPFVNNSASDASRFRILFDNNSVPSSIKKVTITKQTAIPEGAFTDCKYIEEINLPQDVVSIGQYAFYGCSSLARLNSTVDGVFNVPNGVTVIKHQTFLNCLLAEKINLGSNVVTISSQAFYGCKALTTFVIPETVETIGDDAFNGCVSIIKINSEVEGELNIPVNVVSIGATAFKGLAEITKVYIPDTVTSIGNYAFCGCTSIEEMTSPFANNSETDPSVFTVLFDGSSVPASLKRVIITKQATITSDAFKGCKYIEEITIPSNVTSIGSYAFYGCSALLRLNSTVDGVFNVPKSVTEIKSYAFANCLLAETINIGENVVAIRANAFDGCKSLTSFVIPSTTKTIESSAFANCISIVKMNSTVEGELNIPVGVELIGDHAFKGLAGITKAYIPDTVTSIGNYAFNGFSSLEEITLPFANNSATDQSVFNVLFDGSSVPASLKKVIITKQTAITSEAFKDCKYIEEITIPTDVTSIGSYAFYGCSALLRINSNVDGVFNIPTSVTEIKTLTFTNCLLAETINIGENVVAIRANAFEGCKSLTSFVIPSTMETIESSAFANCISIVKMNSTVEGELNIPVGVKLIGDYAFKGLAGITKVCIPNTVTSIGNYAFNGCTSIEEITSPFTNNSATDASVFNILFDGSNVPISLKKVTITKQTAITSEAFKGCKYIEEITIPSNVTSIGSYAFYGCSALSRINSNVDGVFNIPESITEIKEYTFYNCLLAEVVNLGESVINIKDYAFAKCSSIKMFNSAIDGEIIIPESIRDIGTHAFEGLISITKVVIPDSVSAINNDVFKGCNSVEEIILPFVGKKVGETSAYYSVFGYIFGYNSGSIYNHPSENYDIPTSIKKVTVTAQTVIPEYAFRNCNFIEAIILPSTVTSTGTNSFYGCTATVSYTYNATTSIWNGTDVSTSFTGSGTSSDHYQINSAADLAYLASSVNAGESYAGKYFVLNANINLNSLSWTPIGTKNKPFVGTFDGNGKKIYNLSVTMDTAYAGLFGYVSGTVKNLGVFSGTLAPTSKAGTTYVGLLVAYLTGTVENCYSQAAVTTNITNIIYAGGLIGHVDTAATVKDSYASGHISAVSSSGFAYAGGLVGANKGTIDGCLAFGNVTAKGSNETYSRNGGFVAKNDGTLTECYRSETQVLTKYTTTGSAYCDDGTVYSYSNMIAYAQTNWASTIWEYDLKYPRHEIYSFINPSAKNSKAGTVTETTNLSSQIVTVTAVTNPGYTFLGWYLGSDLVHPVSTYSFSVANGVILTPKWSADDATYTVNYYKETLTKNGYVAELVKSVVLDSHTGELVNAVDKGIDGYTFNSYKSKMSGDVVWDDSLVLEVWYTFNTYIREGDYIYFGEYPKSLKTNDVTIVSEEDYRGYFLGSDGYYYKKAVVSPRYAFTSSSGINVYSGETHYFKIEPIRWIVLSEENGKVFIATDYVIDAHNFRDNSETQGASYAVSSVRHWMNSTFYESAFSGLQQEIILSTMLQDVNVEDNIFLLSGSDVEKMDFGFRTKGLSEYAIAMGTPYSPYAMWWLRDKGTTISAGTAVYYNGEIYQHGVDNKNLGVVPAMWIKL